MSPPESPDQQLENPVTTLCKLNASLDFWRHSLLRAKEIDSGAQIIQAERAIADLEQAVMAIRSVHRIP